MFRANNTVRKMFAYQANILKALVEGRAGSCVLGADEKLSDLPAFFDRAMRAWWPRS